MLQKMDESYNLVVIENEEEYQFLKKKFKSSNNHQQYWIGLIETEERNNFK